MQTKIDNSLDFLNKNILDALEQYWQFGLPKDYRLFLMHHNGGNPNPNRFLFKNDLNKRGSVVDGFFGIKKDMNNNLLMNMALYKERIPNSFLPIGDDMFGNLILLSVKGPDYGKVYFWNHEMEADPAQGEVPDYSNLTLIADSFDEFINGLRGEDGA